MVISSLGLKDIITDSGASLVGLELGVYRGENAHWLLSTFSNLTLHGIDPYVPYNDWNGAVNCSDQDLRDGKRADIIADEYLSVFKHQGRYIHHKKTSDEAVSDFNDEQFDFIFIDGLHEYSQVLLDCQNYYGKLKPGGVFSGHDYLAIEGVRRAVDEFAASVLKNVFLMPTDAWYWFK